VLRLMIVSVIAVVGLIACGREDIQEEPASATPQELPQSSPTRERQPTPEPTLEPTPVDSAAAFAAFKTAFEDVYLDIFTTTGAEAFETDYYWVDRIDRATYDKETHRLVYEATIDYEEVYLNDPQEWRSDTWALYRDFARGPWDAVVTSTEDAELGIEPDWPLWTPAVVLNGNVARLTVDCPGDLIYRVQQREATQAEFEDECTFTP